MATSSAIWPWPRMAISSTSTSVPGGASRMVSGSPISVFRFWRLACVRRWWASSAVRMSLVEVLPVEPVTPITLAPSSRRHSRAMDWSSASGSAAVITVPPSSPSRVLGRHQHAGRAGGQRLGGEPPTVGALAAQAHEQVPGSHVTRVDHGALELLHESSLSASRATCTSSNGSLRPSSNSWPCS